MKTFEKIIQSNIEPDISNIWLKDGNLYYYSGSWKPLSLSELPEEVMNDIMEALDEFMSSVGAIPESELDTILS